MSNVVPCVADGNAQPRGGLDSTSEMGLAMPGDRAESFLFPKTANTLDSTGSLSVTGFQERDGSNDLFGAFELQPMIPFSKRPPKAVQDIYNSLPSVARFFPDWPFHPLGLPQSIPKKLKWKDEESIKNQQDWNRELSLTRVHAPGTAAHRLLNHSFEQDVEDFYAEYETFRSNSLQTSLGLAVKFGDEVADIYVKVFRCSLCKFSPRHDDIPNWLYYTKVDENSPRYFYCLGCKGRDGDAQMKSFTNLMTIVKEIVAICNAEENAKKMGMGGAITSAPMARFKRYEVMFSIEVEAAMARRAIKAAKAQHAMNTGEFRQRQLKIPGDFGFSIVGKAVARGVVGRYFTTEIPNLFDNLGPLGQPERSGSTMSPGFPMGMESRDQQSRIPAVFDEDEFHFPVERSHTPPGWPKGYIPPVIADNVYDSQAPPGRPPTPVWFAEEQLTPTISSPPACSTTPPGYPQWLAPSPERVYGESVLYAGATKFTDTSTPRSTTPPGYPESFTLQSSASDEELVSFADAITLANTSSDSSSIFQSEIHAPFRHFSAFIHPEGSFPGDHTPPEYSDGIITWLARTDTPPSPPEEIVLTSSARSSRTLYEDYIPQFDGAGDTPSSSARSSISLPEDFGQQLADTIAVVERSPPRLFEIFRDTPLVDDKQESKEDSLPDPTHPLRRSPVVESSICLHSKGGIRARLPPKTERIPPVKSEGALLYNYTSGEKNKKDLLSQGQPFCPFPTGDYSLYPLSCGGIPAKLPPKAERIPPTRSEQASYYKYKAEGSSFYRPSTDSQPAAQIGRISFSNNNTTAEAQPPLQFAHETSCKYSSDAIVPPRIERRSFYKCKNHNIESTGHISFYKSLASIAEDSLEDYPGSDLSAGWDFDVSLDESPRRLRCLDLLDELIPPRQNEYMGCDSRMWNSRPTGKRGRNVDLSLNPILEDGEPEDGELVGEELVQRGKMKGKTVDRERT
ncbi:hypothetical protein EV426DRAFT_573423 [Tirmania nivea]|nr:hypothetical protein EV426DRAFT_573423 [Tirmania nivea]